MTCSHILGGIPERIAEPGAPRRPVLVAVQFYEVVLAVHILAVVFAFGATFAYPVLLGAVTKADTRALPALYRALHAISQRVIMPGVAAILVFGIYLACASCTCGARSSCSGASASVIVIGARRAAPYLGPPREAPDRGRRAGRGGAPADGRGDVRRRSTMRLVRQVGRSWGR